jgi:phosphohistidine phosphatase
MLLTLVRHAPAEAPGGDVRESERALTAEGRRKLRRLVRALERGELRFDRLLYSPMRRAAETAELLMPLVDGPALVEPLLAQPPSADLLARLSGERPALVGHQPWLGELLGWLVLGARDLGPAFDWKKGGLALLSGEPQPGRMHLTGFLPPGLLRRLHRE